MAALVGRERELRTLQARLDEALAGRGRGVVVAGEAGIGKTRLADELASRAAAAGADVVRGDAYADDRLPFGVWRRARPRLLPADAWEPEGLDPDDARWSVVEDLASAMAGRRAVVVLEDLHWGDESSIWSVERLLRMLRDSPVLLLVTVRTTGEFPEGLLPLARAADDVVVLDGLDDAAIGGLVADVAPGRGPAVAEIRAATGGNPLLVREWAAAPTERGRVPDGAMAVLGLTLAALAPETVGVVQALALAAPHEVPATVLARALAVDVRAVGTAIDDAVRVEVLRRSDGAVRFRHQLLADAALDRTTDGERRDLHLALAEAWTAERPSLEQRAAVARHGLAALPLGAADRAFEAALDAMGAARSAGRADVVVDVGSVAHLAAPFAGTVPAAAQVLVELGDALRDAGDLRGAADACARAADLVGDDAPATLVARAEVGASRTGSAFVPDPPRMARLGAAEARLPAGDSPLRAAILARLGVLGIALPGGVADAHRHGDAAVAMARRLGDPELLADVLLDRYLAPVGPDDLADRAAAAEEIVAIGSRVGRPHVTLLGLEWRAIDRLDRGDRAGADAALAQVDVLAAVMPAPRWRYTAALRAVGSRTVAGDREGALEALGRAAELAPMAADPLEAAGLELTARVAMARLFGVPDPRFDELHQRFRVLAADVPAPFARIQLAWMAAHAGDADPARQLVERFGPDLDGLLGTMAGLVVAHLVAELAADLGLAAHAGSMWRALAPYADRIGVGNGIAIPTPVAATIGRLALLDGDSDGAAAALGSALALAERAGSPVLSACCCRLLAEVPVAAGPEVTLSPDAIGPGPTGATLRREGAVWRFTSRLGDTVVPHMLGIEQLARLLAVPRTPLAALDLAGAPAGRPVNTDLGGLLDAPAKRAYRRRVTELQADIDEAVRHNDPGRSAAAHAELDLLLRELSRAVGLGGRDRPVAADTERARVSVTRSLRRAIAAVAAAAPDLAAHLDRSVRTGRDCQYDPEPATALRWEVTAG